MRKPGKRIIVRATPQEAEAMARRVHELRGQKLKQREIALRLGITREMVAKYLSPNCKAAQTAGLIQ